MRGELQPFLHIIDQGPDAQHLSAKAGSLTPDGKPCVKSSRDAFDSNILAAHSSGASHGSSGGSTAARIASVSLPRGNSTDTGTAQDQLPSNGAGPSGVQAHHRMPTQQELVAAGRMDLLNAIRLWGGFTAVADLMGVRPNTRYTPSPLARRLKTLATCPALPRIAPVAGTVSLVLFIQCYSVPAFCDWLVHTTSLEF